MDGFFELKTATDLRKKLRRDFEKVKSSPLDMDVMFNFFVTAEHLLDWVYPGRSGKQDRTNLRKSSVILMICSHLANGAKHFRLEAPNHESVRKTSTIQPQFFPLGTAPLGTVPLGGVLPGCLLVDLQGEAVQEFGPSISAEFLASRILTFWNAYPLDQAESNKPSAPPTHSS